MSLSVLASRCVVLPQGDIDTDQIIPARYLAGVDRHGLAQGLFAAMRAAKDSPLNDPARRAARVLVAGTNFGCGSSREHAVWALMEWGFRAVIAPSFGDIFKANALKNGLLPVEVAEGFWQALVARLDGTDAEVRIDLALQTVSVGGESCCRFDIDSFARRCILDGVDEFGYLLARLPQIEAFEKGTS